MIGEPEEQRQPWKGNPYLRFLGVKSPSSPPSRMESKSKDQTLNEALAALKTDEGFSA